MLGIAFSPRPSMSAVSCRCPVEGSKLKNFAKLTFPEGPGLNSMALTRMSQRRSSTTAASMFSGEKPYAPPGLAR